MELTDLLVNMVEQQASDLFITVDATPQIKIEGKTIRLGDNPLDIEEVRRLVYSVMNDKQIKAYEGELEMNKALHLPNVGRFRVNVFQQRGEPAMVVRYIKGKIPSISSLGLPEKLQDLILEERGLILVVGGTGTGKSTTLASMLSYRTQHQSGHVLTIEDPIEFIYPHNNALVNQREVGIDTHSYANALKNAMRESPDVIMIGEIRDRETMQHALSYAETGHLCVSTLHANNSNQALDRILNFFPDTAHNQLLMDLSLHLKAIISQRLCRGIDNKRVAAVEMMFNTPFVSDLIQQGKIDEIKDAMTRSKSMQHQTFDGALYELYRQGKITQDEALRNADSKNNLSLKIRLEQGSIGDKNPLIKEITFNKKAPFEHYHSFSIKPLKVSRERRPDMLEILNEGIINILKGKGFKLDSSKPDLEVQYAFGLENVDELELEKIDNEFDSLSDIQSDTKKQATFILNVRDLRFNKDVWRLNARQKVSGEVKSQSEINAILETLLEDFPPG